MSNHKQDYIDSDWRISNETHSCFHPGFCYHKDKTTHGGMSNGLFTQPGRVVSMAMSRQEHCQMTLLAFGDGESISEECYFGDTLYYILEGALCLCGEDSRCLQTGDCLAVPAHTPTQ